MRRVFIITAVLLVAAVAILVLWSWLPASLIIADVARPTELTLRAKDHPDRVYALDVRGSGSINGEAEIALILNGQPYKTVRLNGPVHFAWGGDWYAPEAVVRYTPLSATSGSIKLRYRFRSL
jgi:hypothetical protein